MNWLLHLMAGAVERRHRATLAGLVVATLVLGGFASQQSTDSDLLSFAPEGAMAEAFDRVQEDFAAGGVQLQVVVDAGPDGDVLSEVGLETATRIEEVVRASRVDLADDESAVVSFAAPVIVGLDAMGGNIDEAATAVLSHEGAGSLAGLFSGDLNVAAATARAGLVIVELDPSLTDAAAGQAVRQLDAELREEVSVGGISIHPFNSMLLAGAFAEAGAQEMPRMLGLSLVLIVGILYIQYRALSDVVLGFVGLITTIIWMFGFGVILGPRYLGLVGEFTQVSTIVPVLLIGLGIDYSIHLTSRYREELRQGIAPPPAASTAVRTVGGALVLATITTMVGFLTNVASPLPPIADFGVFTAIGVCSAFVVMTLMVPAARRALDVRPRGVVRANGRREIAETGPVSRLALLMGGVAAVAERVPKVTLAIALGLTVGAGAWGTQIETSFSQGDFIPADSEAGELLDRLDTLFGGDLAETTYTLVDGDFTDPDLVAAVAAAPSSLAPVGDVRAQAETAPVTTPLTVLTSLARQDPGFAREAESLGLRADGTVAADAQMVALYDLARRDAPRQIASVLSPDHRTGLILIPTMAGQDRARTLAASVEGALAPVRDVGAVTTVVSEPLVFAEVLGALTDSQIQGIVITLLAALVLLFVYFGIVERTPVLGLITMIPSIAVVGWVLGTMVLLGLSFNVLTAMVASLAIGIGVPFGIHITNRFIEDRRRYDTIDEAIRQTVTHTGGAMAGSAATTAAGFGVLALSSLVPMRQFGTIVAITIVYSLVAAVLVQPSCLKLWGQWRIRRARRAATAGHEVEVEGRPRVTAASNSTAL